MLKIFNKQRDEVIGLINNSTGEVGDANYELVGQFKSNGEVRNHRNALLGTILPSGQILDPNKRNLASFSSNVLKGTSYNLGSYCSGDGCISSRGQVVAYADRDIKPIWAVSAVTLFFTKQFETRARPDDDDEEEEEAPSSTPEAYPTSSLPAYAQFAQAPSPVQSQPSLPKYPSDAVFKLKPEELYAMNPQERERYCPAVVTRTPQELALLTWNQNQGYEIDVRLHSGYHMARNRFLRGEPPFIRDYEYSFYPEAAYPEDDYLDPFVPMSYTEWKYKPDSEEIRERAWKNAALKGPAKGKEDKPSKSGRPVNTTVVSEQVYTDSVVRLDIKGKPGYDGISLGFAASGNKSYFNFPPRNGTVQDQSPFKLHAHVVSATGLKGSFGRGRLPSLPQIDSDFS